MKQKIVIKANMPSEKSRAKAMELVVKASGVNSVEVTGDGRDRLQVVGVGVDVTCLVSCLRKKTGYADIVLVEEVKEKKPEEKKPEEKKPESPKSVPCYYPHPYYYHHHYGRAPVAVGDQPSDPCSIL